jgi:hypothetical protein
MGFMKEPNKNHRFVGSSDFLRTLVIGLKNHPDNQQSLGSFLIPTQPLVCPFHNRRSTLSMPQQCLLSYNTFYLFSPWQTNKKESKLHFQSSALSIGTLLQFWQGWWMHSYIHTFLVGGGRFRSGYRSKRNCTWVDN